MPIKTKFILSVVLLLAFLLVCVASSREKKGDDKPTYKIIPFAQLNPYEGVQTFVGETYQKIDPDYKWLMQNWKYQMVRDSLEWLDDSFADLKNKVILDDREAIPTNALTVEENSRIVRRLDEILFKYDERRCDYENFRIDHLTTIVPHYAMEFNLPIYRLDAGDRVAKGDDITFRKFVPMKDYIRKIVEWHYWIEDLERTRMVKQRLISKVFNFVRLNEKYNKYFDKEEDSYLRKIYGRPSSFLNKARKDAGKDLCSAENDFGQHDYFVLENGLISRFVLPKGKGEMRLEMINNTNKWLEYRPLDYLLVGPNCEIYVIGVGDIDGGVCT